MLRALDSAPVGFSKINLAHGPYGASKLIIARCPARFQGKYVLKDQIVGDSINAARGSAIHLLLQKITEAHRAEVVLTSQMIDGWVNEALGLYPAAYDQVKMVKDAGIRYISNLPRRVGDEVHCELELGIAAYQEDSFLDDVTPAIAYVKAPYIGENGYPNKEAFFGGKIDRLSIDHRSKTVDVMDHKSTPNASENADNNFQMGCYAWLVSLYYPGYLVRTQIHFAHPDLNFYAPPVEWDANDLKDVEDEIHTRIGAIESFQQYPALPGSGCTYCHMTQQCPEYLQLEQQNARGDINLNVHGISDLQRIARQLTVTGKLYDQLNKVLKDGVEMFCPTSGVAIEGLWYGFKPGDLKVDWKATEANMRVEVKKAHAVLLIDPTNVEAQKLVEMGDLDGMLTKHGLTADSFKQWQNEKLNALWKTDKPELHEMLKKVIVTDRSTRFSGYKN